MGSYKVTDNDTKHKISRLGVLPQEKKSLLEQGPFHIVTCSTIIQRKRLDLVIQTLHRLSQNHSIQWTHIGWGSDGDTIIDYAKKLLSASSVHFCFMGALSNTAVLNFYRHNHVDLFLNLSDSEGVPVSIMEAMSFGIPAAAKDVGWNRDVVVTGLTGYLLPEEVTADEIAEVISRVFIKKSTNTIQPDNIIKFIADKYDINKNYAVFYQEIIHDAKQIND